MKHCLLLLALVTFLSTTMTFPLSAEEKKYKVLTIQHQDFEPYTLSIKGFKQGIKSSEMADNIVYETYNAKTDLKAMDEFLKQLSKRDDVDLVLSVGTQATQRVVKEIKKIPVIFTDLGDPEYSGIINDWKSSKANFTGVETKNYVTLGINLLHELISFKSIGMIYLKDAPSHEGSIVQITKLGQEAGFNFINQGLEYRDPQGNRLSNEELRKGIKEALDKVVPNVDVFYVQISKTFDVNFDLFLDMFKKINIPSAGDPIYINKGVVMGIGKDKVEFGKQCAKYCVKILKGTDPATLPMDIGKKFSILLNIKAASIVGYNPSIDLLSAADDIYETIETKE